MPVTITQALNKYNFSRNPIVLKATVNTRLSTAGNYWSQTITFINAPTGAGVIFSVSWEGVAVEMESMATPIIANGDYYRLKAGGESLADWVEHFAEDIASNYYIGSNYDISYTPTTVTITAKEKGAEWNMTLVDIPGTVTTDYTLGTETLGTNTVVRDNFKVFVEIWDAINNEKKFTVEMLHTEDNFSGITYTSSSFEVRLEKILHALHSFVFMREATDTDMMLVEDYMFRQFYIRYYESYGAPAAAKYYYLDDNSGDYYYTLRGGLNARAWLNSTFWDDYVPPDYQFLTWQKRIKDVFSNQPEWLGWIHTNPAGFENSGFCRLTIYYTDATSSSHDVQAFNNTANRNVLFIMACGYFQVVEPVATPAKTVDYWTMQVYGERPSLSAAPLSETFRFNLIDAVLPTYTRYIAFSNSLGTYDVLACTGKMVHGIDISGVVLKEWLPDDYEASDGMYQASDAEGGETYDLNSGLLDKHELLFWLQELLMAQKAVIVSQDADTIDCVFQPVHIRKKSIKIYEDMATLDKFYIAFEAMNANAYIGKSEVTV